MKDQRFDDITDIQANVTYELNNVQKKEAFWTVSHGYLDVTYA